MTESSLLKAESEREDNKTKEMMKYDRAIWKGKNTSEM